MTNLMINLYESAEFEYDMMKSWVHINLEMLRDMFNRFEENCEDYNGDEDTEMLKYVRACLVNYFNSKARLNHYDSRKYIISDDEASELDKENYEKITIGEYNIYVSMAYLMSELEEQLAF